MVVRTTGSIELTGMDKSVVATRKAGWAVKLWALSQDGCRQPGEAPCPRTMLWASSGHLWLETRTFPCPGWHRPRGENIALLLDIPWRVNSDAGDKHPQGSGFTLGPPGRQQRGLILMERPGRGIKSFLVMRGMLRGEGRYREMHLLYVWRSGGLFIRAALMMCHSRFIWKLHGSQKSKQIHYIIFKRRLTVACRLLDSCCSNLLQTLYKWPPSVFSWALCGWIVILVSTRVAFQMQTLFPV